jgi:hypothetical protein
MKTNVDLWIDEHWEELKKQFVAWPEAMAIAKELGYDVQESS